VSFLSVQNSAGRRVSAAHAVATGQRTVLRQVVHAHANHLRISGGEGGQRLLEALRLQAAARRAVRVVEAGEQRRSCVSFDTRPISP